MRGFVSVGLAIFLSCLVTAPGHADTGQVWQGADGTTHKRLGNDFYMANPGHRAVVGVFTSLGARLVTGPTLHDARQRARQDWCDRPDNYRCDFAVECEGGWAALAYPRQRARSGVDVAGFACGYPDPASAKRAATEKCAKNGGLGCGVGSETDGHHLAFLGNQFQESTVAQTQPRKETTTVREGTSKNPDGKGRNPANPETEWIGSCRETAFVSCSVRKWVDFSGPSGTGGSVSIFHSFERGEHEMRVVFYFKDTRNYGPRVEKNYSFSGAVPATVTLNFDDNDVYRCPCLVSRAADYDNNFSTATGDEIFCRIAGSGARQAQERNAEIISRMQKAKWVDIEIQVKGGVWRGGTHLNGVTRLIRETKSEGEKIARSLD